MYTVVIHRQAQKKLKSLEPDSRVRITEAIYLLGANPEDVRIDVKKLKGSQGYRLRIGQWRILFKKENVLKIISIEKIGARGDIYK